ncbi:3-phosphoshikimate 1-carboxyvinyltransferase [candidate division NPL-UPA2 bacterium Unc8]|uniref:3-phosphoshikimate 1-carboxyvinyltransferase n=1 Tax=candidate division NPL-UPA2 bacterium Unc8 TaxID=1980939 RepID=A0A399FXG6_UNCN2|nr:3-phosphoshikimate 1-carboxyvinyltransferase 1 [Bacillota bacterium]MBT9147526.1 3-phosphoshikimate 1-carboxyvinyltransferase 1 [Bacillota bacterium]RIH99832.1 MAG: 3-phosphoshikimate 1-carboxyvinyltransferase [candidate division NPL-UPA2 bacterium Unc8]
MTGEIRISPREGLRGKIKVPGDKSIAHRAVMVASIATGRSEIIGFPENEDCLSTIRIFQALGVQIEITGDRLIINGKGLGGLSEPENVLDAGNSGTTLRLLLGILSGQDFCSIITGDESLRRRPMRRVVEPLSRMGAEIIGRGEENLAPIAIKGKKLAPINYLSPIASAQVKSSILLAGLYAEGETSVEEPAKSRDHTERMLRLFGAEMKNDGLKVAVKGRAKLVGREFRIPGDISSASFFLVAAAILPNSEITITEVGINPTRKAVLDVLEEMGVKVNLTNVREGIPEPVADITVRSAKPLKPVNLKGEMVIRIIDEIPILTVVASLADGESSILGAGELRVKETDRIRALRVNLTRLGVRVREVSDGLIIQGGSHLQERDSLDSYGDHRIAMAMIIAAMASKKGATVLNTDCINTSFPQFMNILNTCNYSGG